MGLYAEAGTKKACGGSVLKHLPRRETFAATQLCANWRSINITPQLWRNGVELQMSTKKEWRVEAY